MKLIKARAFNKKEKIFIYFWLKNFNWGSWGIEKELIEMGKRHELENWQLFTGKQDKVGIEIYDGDILDIDYAPQHFSNEPFTLRSLVFWDNDQWKVNGQYIREGLGSPNRDSTIALKSRVIGNIYQNQELVEELKERTDQCLKLKPSENAIAPTMFNSTADKYIDVVKDLREMRTELEPLDEGEVVQFLLDEFLDCHIYNGTEKAIAQAICNRFGSVRREG